MPATVVIPFSRTKPAVPRSSIRRSVCLQDILYKPQGKTATSKNSLAVTAVTPFCWDSPLAAPRFELFQRQLNKAKSEKPYFFVKIARDCGRLTNERSIYIIRTFVLLRMEKMAMKQTTSLLRVGTMANALFLLFPGSFFSCLPIPYTIGCNPPGPFPFRHWACFYSDTQHRSSGMERAGR